MNEAAKALGGLAIFTALVGYYFAPTTAERPAEPATAAAEALDFCDIAKCVPCPSGGCGQTAPINFCCTPTGFCEPTTDLGDCDPDDLIAVCECGQSNADGSITCFEC